MIKSTPPDSFPDASGNQQNIDKDRSIFQEKWRETHPEIEAFENLGDLEHTWLAMPLTKEEGKALWQNVMNQAQLLSSSQIEQYKLKESRNAQVPTTLDDLAELDEELTGPAIEKETKKAFPMIEKPTSAEDVTDITAKIPSTLHELDPNLTKPEYQKLKAEQARIEQEIYSRVYNQAKQAHPNLTPEQFNETAASIETAHLQKEYPNLDLSTLTFREAVKLETFERIRQSYPNADQETLQKEAEIASSDIKWQVHDYFSNYTYLGMKMTEEEYNATMNNMAWGCCEALQAEEEQQEVVKEIYKEGDVSLEGEV